MAAFIGSCLAGFLNYFLLGHEFTLNEILALGQGYGWYSMSGILFTQLHSAELGGIALLTDLFREIVAILLMYTMGWRFPRPAISSAGATSMDVTLAMVKQSCGHTLCTTCHDERLTLKSTRSTFNYCVFKLLSN